MGRLETSVNESEAQPIFQEIQGQIVQLNDMCARLEHQVSREPVNKRRQLKIKVDQLKYDNRGLESSFNAIQMRLANKWRHAHERNELLTQRFRPNETTLNFEDQELLLNDRMKGAHRGVDDLIGNAESVLATLKSQHFNLKGVRKAVHSIGQTLGLSNTTIGLIERRVSEDMTIFIVGCIVVIIFMYSFYCFWTR
uniref:Golgi SNAP receptor complex member 2 n=1 Tax=Bursaphelenchus xylophilus TaxID=6326 RepID=A0A1I7SMR9_BURXY